MTRFETETGKQSHSRSWLHNDWANSLCLLQNIFTFTRQLHLLSTKVLKLKNCQLQDRKSWISAFFLFDPYISSLYRYIMCEARRKMVFIPCMWLHSLLGLAVQAAGQVFLVGLSFSLCKAKQLVDFWLDVGLFCFLKHKKSYRKMPLWQLKEEGSKREKACQVEGEIFFFTCMACALLHHVRATLCLSSFFSLSFLSVSVWGCVWMWRPGERSVEAGGGIYGLFLTTAAKSLLMQQVCRTHCVHHTASQ